MDSISFSIADWHVSSNVLNTEDLWQSWAHDQLDIHTLAQCKPDLNFLPAMQRRRLSLPAKLMFDAAWTLLPKTDTCPVIYASHNGEINRSFDLYLDLLQNNGVSPTSFGLSVHNALSGQWSLLRKDMSEINAISASQSQWELAMIEAYLLLQEGAEKVLLISVDEPVKSDIETSGYSESLPFAYALAAVITPGDDWKLSKLPHTFGAAIDENRQKSDYQGPLDWVKHGLLKDTHWIQNYVNDRWEWLKKTHDI